MKTLFALLLLMTLSSMSLFAQKIEFEALEINYGDIAKGANGVRVFRFKNTGTAPLIISDVQKTCGCTSPSFTNTPVMPGETGEIQVKYDTQRLGAFSKFVTVHSNALEQQMVQLKIFGNIKESENLPECQKTLFKN
jgi:hypothetical protein